MVSPSRSCLSNILLPNCIYIDVNEFKLFIHRTCVDQRHQHDEVEEEVDDHGDDDLPVDLAEPLPVFLHSAVVNIPVLEREHNPTVLQGVGELLDHVDLPELLDNNELGDEDSHGLENIEEDEQQAVVI